MDRDVLRELFENPGEASVEIVEERDGGRRTVAEIEAAPFASRCAYCEEKTELLRVDPGVDVDEFAACPVHAFSQIIAIEEQVEGVAL